MLEENFKNDLVYVINTYADKGLTIGTQYYIFKDVFNELSKLYNNFLQEEQNKMKQEEPKEEVKEEEE